MNAFVTGSWAYGEPTEASDLDLVIRVDGGDDGSAGFFETADEVCVDGGSYSSLRFGNLNLIVCWTDDAYNMWKEAREQCLRECGDTSVSRDRAIEIHDALREAYGIKEDY